MKCRSYFDFPVPLTDISPKLELLKVVPLLGNCPKTGNSTDRIPFKTNPIRHIISILPRLSPFEIQTISCYFF